MRILTLLTFAALLVPCPADAQVHPERVRSVTTVKAPRAVVERYQRNALTRERETERFTRTVRLGPNGALDISNIAGDIVVTRAAGNDVTIEVVKTAVGGSTAEAREQLALVEVDITERAGRAEVRTRYPRGEQGPGPHRRHINVSVAFTVTAPAATRITAKSISGNISVRDVQGDLSLESTSGDVRIANAARIPSAKSISGNVEVADAKLDGSMDASSISGNLQLRRVTARRLNLSTISGNLVLQDVSCELADMKSVSGNVRFTGPLSPGGRYEMRSHSGEVLVSVAPGAGFTVEATSFSGGIRTDLPLTGDIADTRRRQRSLRGTYGDGSAVLVLASFSGSIVISKQ